MIKILKIFTIVFLCSNLAYSQDTTAVKKVKKVKILPVPAFGYSPETRTYLGAVALFTFNMYNDSITRISNAKIEFNYTQNKQFILESDWNYFFKDEKWFTKGKIHYSKYPDFYYGVGNNTPDSNKLLYDSNRFVFEASLLKRIGNKLFTGVNIKYIDYTNVSYEETTLSYSELVSSSTFGIGYSLLKDSRNSILTPTKGVYFYANIGYSSGNDEYTEATLDLRYYKTWKDKYTLALRFLNDFNFGTPTFYDYAFLGGDKNVRGYTYGRYRDNNLTTVQTEFRMPIVWRFGLAAFGGMSNVYPKINEMKFDEYKYNYGFGLRFLVDKKDNTFLRFDYAIGENGNDGFYVSFGESF